MKIIVLVGTALCGSFLCTSCATKKYVTRTIAPVETRVTATETKNADQDKQLTSESAAIEGLDRDLSHTKELLATTDQKAVAAGNSAKVADQKADNAQKTADGAAQAAAGAAQSATGARTLTESLGRSVDAMNRFKVSKSAALLFPINGWTVNDEAKAQLAAFCQALNGLERYVVEVQGFTDKSGPVEVNEILSQRRAQEVANYLATECKVPLHNMTMLGSGNAQPVADDSTRDGRKQNRRVEVRLLVPEVTAVAQTISR